MKSRPSRHSRTTDPAAQAITVGVTIMLVLASLVSWLGLRTYQSQHEQQQRAFFLQAGRQGALNLTTISHTEVEADVQRVLDSSTGTFHDEFPQRSGPFIDVIKQAQSTSVGTITAAGLESSQTIELK